MKQESSWNDDHYESPPLSTMKSLTWNRYMLGGYLTKSKMKQVECAFWRDVTKLPIYYWILFLIKFSFLTQCFVDFCLFHPLLERLRLNNSPFNSDFHPLSGQSFCSIDSSYRPKPKIKALSIHPRILYTSYYCESGRSFWKLPINHATLEELEICPDLKEARSLAPFVKRWMYPC